MKQEFAPQMDVAKPTKIPLMSPAPLPSEKTALNVWPLPEPALGVTETACGVWAGLLTKTVYVPN